MSADSHTFRASRPRAVLWDMDGTLVDTEPYWIATEYELVAEFGGTWSHEHATAVVGRDLRDTARYMQEHGNVQLPVDDVVNRLLDGVIVRVRQRIPWRPGARELLVALRSAGVPCALVTMSWRRFVDAVVAALPPGTFAVTITGDEVSHGKPHPEPYLAAAAALGLHAHDCVAIEDSPTGVRSAVTAGCRTFAVPNVVDVPQGPDHTVVGSLLELDLVSLGVVAPGPARRDTPPTRRWWWVLVAMVGVAAVATGAAIAVRDDTAPPPLPDIAVSAWAPYWTLPEATASLTAHGTLLHEVSPFWFETTASGTIELPATVGADATLPLIAAARASGALVIPSISDATGKGSMAAMLADSARRAQHVATIVALVSDNGFDGIDIDYEGFAFGDDYSTWETTRPNWIAFLGELAAELHARGALLTVSVPPIYDTERTRESGNWVYDYAAMGDVVDRIRIMAYDFSVAEPGPIAPVQWVRSAVRAAKRAVADDSKLVLGIGLYGRNWVAATTGTCPATAEGTAPVTQRSVTDLAAKRGATPIHDAATGEAAFTYRLEVGDGSTSCTQVREVRYIDEQGARARLDIARQERIGGVVLWALGFDSDTTWSEIATVARPRGAPTSTIAAQP